MQAVRWQKPGALPQTLRGCIAACCAAASLVALRPAQAQTVPAAKFTGPVASNASSALPVDPSSLTRLQGDVTDGSGALIPSARVELRSSAGALENTVSTDQAGHYSVLGLSAGTYVLAVSAPGFKPALTTVVLRPGESRTMEAIALAIPAGHADAYVTLNREQIAAAEVHAAEQQRIIGFPDFYTSFVWDAAPLNARQKLSLGVHATTDRMAFVTAGLVAGGEQINNTFPEYGRGWSGYGKRYGAAYTDGFVGKFLGSAILPSVFHQDPRYFYMGPNGTLKHRIEHAVVSGFLTRGDNGRMEPNYSHILGNAGAGAISTLYHPASNSAGKLALDNALLGTVGEAGVNLVRELFLKRFVRGGDVDANGMPPR